MWRSLDIIVEVLHRSEENGDSETKRKAAILINLVVNIDFICGIMLLKNIMYKTKLLSDFLQGESIDMAAAMVENFGGYQISKLKLYYRTQFYAVMDTLACELKDKLKLVKDTFNDFLLALNPDNPGPPEAIARLVASFPALFSEESSSGIHNELQIFFLYVRKEFEDGSRGELSTSSAGYLALELARRHSLFKTTAKLYQFFLSAAPSVCKNERRFSALRLVKSYLPSTMSADRLDDCMELASEKDLVDSIDLTKVAKKWSLLKNRREKIE